MKQKQIFIILGAIGIIFLLLFWLVVLTLVFKNLRESSNKSNDPVMVNLTLCDEDAGNLCIVTFGANSLNRMVIHFQLPTPDYPLFYVKATNRGTVSVYTCEVDEVPVVATEAPAIEPVATDVIATEAVATEAPATESVATNAAETEVVEPAPTSARCTGVRTPLGETIDVEVYTTDGDKLIGRGTFLVSAIALSTPISLPSETPTEEATPPEEPVATEPPAVATEAPFVTEEPIATEVPVTEEVPTPDPTLP